MLLTVLPNVYVSVPCIAACVQHVNKKINLLRNLSIPEQFYCECEGPGIFISHMTVCCHVTDDRDRGEAAILPVLPDEKLRRRL